MGTRRRHPQRSLAVVWLGILTLLLALLTPMLSNASTDASQVRTSEEACDPGFARNERTGECEPLTIPAQIQAQPDCEEGTTLNERTGECEPDTPGDFQQPPAECPEGTERSPETGACEPTATETSTETATETPTDPPLVAETAVPPEPATLTLNKGACDDPSFDPSTATGLQAFLDACFSPDGEFEFTVTGGEGFQATASTELGTLVMEVPTGTITITETIPEGWGEPAVFCWSSLLPTPSDTPFIGNGPQWDVSPGEQVECWWFNVAQPPAGTHTIRVEKRVCPEGFVVPEDYLTLATGCQGTLEDVGFEMTVDGGTDEEMTDASGEIEWPGVDLGGSGQVQLTEQIPEGYGEPIVWCVDFPIEAADAQDYEFYQLTPTGGQVTALPEQAEPYIFHCTFFNVLADGGDPGGLTDPSSQEGGEGVEVTVIKHRCPLGVPEDTTLDEYLVICAELFPGVGFTLEHAGGSLPGETGEDGQVTWPGVPAGEIAIQEDIPEGYKDPLAFCTTFAGEQELDSGQVTATGGTVTLTVPDEATAVVCWLINIQDESAGSITIHKWVCPPGYEIDTMVEDPLTACTETGGGVTFTIDDGNPPDPDQTLVTSEDQGTVVFAGLEPGSHTITEEVPEGIEHATGWCASIGQVQALDNPPRLVIDLAEGEHWECDWLNVPDDGQPEVNTVTMTKWRCPLGIPHEAFDQDSFAATCTDPHEEIDFTLESEAVSDTKATDASGEVVWEDIPAGPFSIQEAIPAGYLDPYVYCTYTPEGENALAMQWAEEPLPGGLLQLEMGETADDLTCAWYNVPDEDANNSITVIKQICPPGTSPDSNDVGDYHAACNTAHEGVDFLLDAPHGLFLDTTDGNGTIEWTGVPLGDFSIQETIPEGYGDPVVFCNFADVIQGIGFQNGPVARIQADGGLVSAWIEEPGNVDYICYFFNIPEEPEENSVIIRKWICPEGTGYDEIQGWYQGNCIQQHNGVEFTVTSGIGIAVQETAGGVAQFDGLPAGTAGIQETVPDGFGEPIVFCAPEDSLWQQMDAPTGYWEIDLIDDGISENWTCYVFNIPGEPPSITVLKWTCPPGYDLLAEGADPQVDCTEATNGITFELRYSGHEEVETSQATGDVIEGGVVFDGLQPDLYQITELVPDGIGQVFVLECTGHLMGVLQPYPLEMGNVLDGIDLDTGEHLTCHWYNVPEPEGGELTVIKYICATESFVDDVDCEIFEDSASFDLLLWNTEDGAWEVIDTQVTDGAGMIAWPDVAPGDYRLDEHDGSWCHLETTPVFGPGDGFSVFDGEATLVEVYNCDPDWSTTTIPEKYPNTGVGPDDDDWLPVRP